MNRFWGFFKGHMIRNDDPVEKSIKDSNEALALKLFTARESEGPAAAAHAAAEAVTEADQMLRQAEVSMTIAKASAKSARKMAKTHRKAGAKAAAKASAANVNSAAKSARATRMAQTSAFEEVQDILEENETKERPGPNATG